MGSNGLLSSTFECIRSPSCSKGKTTPDKARHGLLIMPILVATLVCADSWEPIAETDFYSEDRSRMLEMQPHPEGQLKPGHCRVTLFRGRMSIWSRFLINDLAPVRVFVANSGRYVVTMDEWGRVGKLPIVIYGRRGELIRVHSTESLGIKLDCEHVEMSVSSYWWSKDSISFFGPDEETFFIRLHWGKLILVQLRDGALMDEEWYHVTKEWAMPESRWKALHEFAETEVQTHALQFLKSTEPEKRRTGAIVCGQEKLRSAIPALRKLLNDKTCYLRIVQEKVTRVYFVRKAAKEALESMGEEADGKTIEEPDVKQEREPSERKLR